MDFEVHTKDTTEVLSKGGTFNVHCFADMDDEGNTTPVIFKSQILQEPKIIDNVAGKEGELILTHEGERAGQIDANGELIIDPQGDDASKYSRGGTDDAFLLYED